MKLFVSLFSTLHGLSELELVIPGHNYQMSEIMSKYNFDVVKISNISENYLPEYCEPNLRILKVRQQGRIKGDHIKNPTRLEKFFHCVNISLGHL